LEAEFVVGAKDSDRVCSVDELGRLDFFELGVVSFFVTITLTLLHFGVEDLGFVVRSWGGEFGENIFGVKELGIEALRGLVATANDENFGRHVTGRRRLGSLNRCEELLEHPQQRVVVLGTENLGDESSALSQKLRGQLHRLKDQLCLREGILDPSGTDIGRTIVNDSVCFPMFDMRPNGSAALVRCDIALEGNDSRNGLDRSEIDTNDDTLVRHAFCRHLTPTLEALLELESEG
jgi:hypothetical protein